MDRKRYGRRQEKKEIATPKYRPPDAAWVIRHSKRRSAKITVP